MARIVVMEEYPELRPPISIYKHGMDEEAKRRARSMLMKATAEKLLLKGRFTKPVNSEVSLAVKSWLI